MSLSDWFTDDRLNRHPWLWPIYAAYGFFHWPFVLLHRRYRG